MVIKIRVEVEIISESKGNLVNIKVNVGIKRATHIVHNDAKIV